MGRVQRALQIRLDQAALIALGLAVAGGITGVASAAPPQTSSSRPAQATPANATPPPVEWSWPTEEQWIVAAVARDLAEMALYAKGKATAPEIKLRAAPDEKTVRYEVAVAATVLGSPAFSHPVAIGTHPWDPECYAPLASQLLARLHLVRAAAASSKPAYVPLLHPTSDVLVRENERISRGLQKAILDPVLHEQAALLLATLSLRESAIGLSDIRHQLNRLTAHLALATALRGHEPPSADRVLASIALSALVGRQREAVELVDARLKTSTSPEERAWLVALKMRSTGDWRLLPDPHTSTLLERLEHVRAVVNMKSSLEALKSLEPNPEPVVDWGRLLVRRSIAVEVGHTVATTRVPEELAETASLLRASEGRDLVLDRLATELGARPGACISVTRRGPQPRVIDWGTWAAYCQRHLLAAVFVQEHFLREGLGLQKEADELRKDMTARFGALPLFPFVEAAWNSSPAGQPGDSSNVQQDAAYCSPAAQLVRRVPEQVPPVLWPLLVQRCPRSCWKKELVDPGLWFQPRLPRETAMDYENTKPLFYWGLVREHAERALESLHALAPYDLWILRDLLAVRYLGEATPAETEELWGPVREYDAGLKWNLLAAARDDATYLRYAKEACDSDVEACGVLSDELYMHGLGTDARSLFERAYANARDRVSLSNHESQAIDDYFDRGQTERALKVAQEGAAVYSEAGLEDMGRVLERLGKYEQAEALYKEMAERYEGSRWHLDVFYFRYQHRIGGDLFQEQATEVTQRVFPRGLERVSLNEWKEPPFPIEGASVPDGSARAASLRQAGVVAGDVILAIDHYRVRNDTQYLCVIRLTDAPTINLLVWRGGRILELNGPVLRLHFGPPLAN